MSAVIPFPTRYVKPGPDKSEAQSAEETWDALLRLDPIVLNLNRNSLADRLGLSRSTLFKHITVLTECGLIAPPPGALADRLNRRAAELEAGVTRLPGRFEQKFPSLSDNRTQKTNKTVDRTQTPKKTVDRTHPENTVNRTPIPKRIVDRTPPKNVTVSSLSSPCSPSPVTPSPLSPSHPSSCVSKARETAAIELPVAGLTPVRGILGLARAGKLDAADVKFLRKFAPAKKPGRPTKTSTTSTPAADDNQQYWNAAVDGTTQNLKRQYQEMWAQANGVSGAKFHELETDHPEWAKLFKAAAVNVLKHGIEVGRFLQVAKDTCPRNLKLPPVSWLASQTTVEKVLTWKSPEEREAEKSKADERKAFDGMDWDELVARSREAGLYE